MKKYFERFLCLIFAAVLLCVSFAGCAKISYVTDGAVKAIGEINSGEWTTVNDESQLDLSESSTDEIVIDELVPGTYGGIEFNDLDDVADYYVQAYDYTKSLTAQYLDADGNEQTFYKLLGDEDLNVGDVYIDGKVNSIINSLVPGIVSSLYSANTYGLVPSSNRNPELDNNLENDERKNDHDFRTSMLTSDDILAANVKDNNDGTITITIQPKAVELSFKGDDAQGRFFNSVGDIKSTVESFTILSFEQGGVDENVIVDYEGGTGSVTIDTSTKEIIEADYLMIVNVAVTHATVTVVKDKSASLTITYKNHYPASDEYLMETKGIERLS